MASKTTSLATTAERAAVKWSSTPWQFAQVNAVLMAPSNGRPHRSQNGGFTNRTRWKQFAHTYPSVAVARSAAHNWQTGG